MYEELVCLMFIGNVKLQITSLARWLHMRGMQLDELISNEQESDASLEITAIATRVVSGDAAAERLLVLRLLPGLSAMCRRHFGQGPSASDARQEALLILLQKLRASEIKNLSAVPAFMRGVVQNLSRNAARERANCPVFQTEDLAFLANTVATAHSTSAALALEQHQLRALVQRCLDELPQERDRDILFRSYILEQDKQQVCSALKLNSDSFDRVISRAKQRLRALIAPIIGRNGGQYD